MVELVVTSSFNLSTGKNATHLEVRRGNVTVSTVALSPLEYAQLVKQALSVEPYAEQQSSQLDQLIATADEFDTPEDDYPQTSSLQQVKARVKPPPVVPPAPPAPGTGAATDLPSGVTPVPMPTVGKPKAVRTIGSLLERQYQPKVTLFGEDFDEGPNASPVSASEV